MLGCNDDGSGHVDVRIRNRGCIESHLEVVDVNVTGFITVNHRLNSTSGQIITGIMTTA